MKRLLALALILALAVLAGCRKRHTGLREELLRMGACDSRGVPPGTDASEKRYLPAVTDPGCAERIAGEENTRILRNASQAEVLLLNADRVSRCLSSWIGPDGKRRGGDSWKEIGEHYQGSSVIARSTVKGYEFAQAAAGILLDPGSFSQARQGSRSRDEHEFSPDFLLRIRSGPREVVVVVSIRSETVRYAEPGEEGEMGFFYGDDCAPAVPALRALARECFADDERFADPSPGPADRSSNGE